MAASRPNGRTRVSARWMVRARVRTLILCAALLIARPETVIAESAVSPLTVGAAMSLRYVMPPLTETFRARDGGSPIHVSYAASGDVRKQVEGGAPIDAVVLADARSVDALLGHRHADATTRRVVATNTLVLIGPVNGSTPLTFETVDALPEGEMISIGEPGSVPAGRYAREAFRNLGRWNGLRGRVIFAGHVGAVLSYVRRGEVAAAVVYGTEIRGVADVRVLDRARGAWAPTPEIVAAVVTGSPQHDRARAFLEFLGSSAARTILTEYGFGVP